MTEHVPFPSIGALYNVIKTYEVYPYFFNNPQAYRGKVKLHGTNVGVRVMKDSVVAQSRNQDLTPSDNMSGFYQFVEENEVFFLAMWKGVDFTIFGEWCGPGIMKKTAVNLVPEKFFAIFMLQFGIYDADHDDETAQVIFEPDLIAEYLGAERQRVHVLPWYGDEIVINWNDRDSLQAAADKGTAAVQAVEECDPWVKQTYGVEGIGEGVVYYPLGVSSRKRMGDFMWKAKGVAHKVVKSDKIVEIDPEVLANVDAFVVRFVTEARLEQGLAEIGGKADVKLTGKFLAWLGKDVEKESQDELAASELDWKDVVKAVSTAARQWYLAKATAI